MVRRLLAIPAASEDSIGVRAIGQSGRLEGDPGGDADTDQVGVAVPCDSGGRAEVAQVRAGSDDGCELGHVGRIPVLIVKGDTEEGVGRDALQGSVPIVQARFDFPDEQAGVALADRIRGGIVAPPGDT